MSGSASPQLENGYTRIANELLEAIIKYPFCATEYKIVWLVIRNTYGWNKKEALMSYGMIAKEINVSISYVKKIMKNLIKNMVILRAKQKNRNLLALNKTYTLWGCG